MPAKDVEAKRATFKKYYEGHREQVCAKNKLDRDKAKTWLADLKRFPCVDCGGTFPPCVMDWDHRPGEEKLFQLGTAVRWGRTAALAEIAKCDLVCANCHRIRTSQRGGHRFAF